MIAVADIVSRIVESDSFAKEGIQNGLLNFSAYADRIHKRIEKETLKTVRTGTIVVALSRLAKKLKKSAFLFPTISFTNLSVKSSLSSLTFEKTADIERKVSILHPFTLPSQDMFSITEGQTEVTLVFSMQLLEKLKNHFRIKPRREINDLVGVTVTVSPKLISEPNSHYAILALLAARQIAIVACITTFTEVSFVVKKEDMEKTVDSVAVHFTKNT